MAKRVFSNKAKLDLRATDVYRTERGKREFKGVKRPGTYYYYSSIDMDKYKDCDNVVFLTARSQYAPEQKKSIIFIFD